eukprot:CFRG0452T1
MFSYLRRRSRLNTIDDNCSDTLQDLVALVRGLLTQHALPQVERSPALLFLYRKVQIRIAVLMKLGMLSRDRFYRLRAAGHVVRYEKGVPAISKALRKMLETTEKCSGSKKEQALFEKYSKLYFKWWYTAYQTPVNQEDISQHSRRDKPLDVLDELLADMERYVVTPSTSKIKRIANTRTKSNFWPRPNSMVSFTEVEEEQEKQNHYTVHTGKIQNVFAKSSGRTSDLTYDQPGTIMLVSKKIHVKDAFAVDNVPKNEVDASDALDTDSWKIDINNNLQNGLNTTKSDVTGSDSGLDHGTSNSDRNGTTPGAEGTGAMPGTVSDSSNCRISFSPLAEKVSSCTPSHKQIEFVQSSVNNGKSSVASENVARHSLSELVGDARYGDKISTKRMRSVLRHASMGGNIMKDKLLEIPLGFKTEGRASVSVEQSNENAQDGCWEGASHVSSCIPEGTQTRAGGVGGVDKNLPISEVLTGSDRKGGSEHRKNRWKNRVMRSLVRKGSKLSGQSRDELKPPRIISAPRSTTVGPRPGIVATPPQLNEHGDILRNGKSTTSRRPSLP